MVFKSKKIGVISLGCDKNRVDTEKMLAILGAENITNDVLEAEVLIVNSCAFLESARKEALEAVFECDSYREEGKLEKLILTGCLPQKFIGELFDELTEVDAFLGTADYELLPEVIERIYNGERVNYVGKKDWVQKQERIVTTPLHYAYLKIADGCNNFCTYCLIPAIRGRYRSENMENLIAEAESLGDVAELILVAQETTIYGVDLYGKKSLHILLKELCKINGIKMIRIMYCYPEEIYDELIETMANEKKICNYLDMPIQHCSDAVLKRMGRRTTKDELIAIINKLRDRIPDIVLRTTLIAGFPGETEENHQEMMEFVDEMEFDRLGVFTYSPEENTPAAAMDNQLDEDTKCDWRDEIMELQQEIAFDKSEGMIGRELLVMVEGKIANEPAYVGRTYMDAPGIDGNIFINTGEEFISGDLVKVKVIGANEYDVIGEVL